jgi:chemotaxis protein methyltransferase CheR
MPNASTERRHDWSDGELRAVASFVRDRAGLVFGGSRIGSAEDAMRRTMSRFGIGTTHELRRRVASNDGVRDVLLDELTIGETYFFREPRQLDRVRRTLVAVGADPGRHGAPLRVWSAGCASGEEPYSLAIILREEHLAHDAFVLGTDIAVARLAAARRARYTRWALRGVSDDRIDAYFAREGKHFVLAEAIRRMVDFRTVNLVADEPLPPEISNMDVILCRNVLIYMDLSAISRIAARLIGALAPDGWLFLGASDPPLASLVECDVVVTPEGLAYRRPDARRAAARSATSPRIDIAIETTPIIDDANAQSVRSVAMPIREPVATSPNDGALLAVPPADRATAGREAYRSGDYETAAALSQASIAARASRQSPPRALGVRDAVNVPVDVAESITLVRSLSNLGRLHAAADACVSALERHAMSAELAYLHAVILTQLGHFAAAATAARRALYLDRSFVLAHLALGEALARSGHERRARRSFQNAVDLLESAPPDAIVMGGEGESAARFLRIGLSRLNPLTPGNSAGNDTNDSTGIRRSR